MSLPTNSVRGFYSSEGPELIPDVDLKRQVISHKVKNNVAFFPEV